MGLNLQKELYLSLFHYNLNLSYLALKPFYLNRTDLYLHCMQCSVRNTLEIGHILLHLYLFCIEMKNDKSLWENGMQEWVICEIEEFLWYWKVQSLVQELGVVYLTHHL